MAGKREKQKAERERAILKAAGRLFARRGFAETTIEDIAERAGLAVGTVYNYFESKSEILGAILSRDTSEAIGAGEGILEKPPARPEKAVGALLDIYTGIFSTHDRALWRQILAAAMTQPKSVGPRLFGEDIRLIAQLTTLIRELKTRGRLAPGLDEGRAAITLYSVWITWIMLFVMSDDVSLDRVRSEIRNGVALVVGGLE